MGDAFDPRNPATVTSKTCHASSRVPDLGLERNLDCSHSVYILKCSPQILGGPFCWYVGLSDDVKKRLMDHFAGKGAQFTREHPPISIELVWPVSSEAAEAYAFFAMAKKLPQTAVLEGRLGGWTQTVSNPSQLSKLMLQDAHRMLKSKCLACGLPDQAAGDAVCKKKIPDSCPITCSNCSETLMVTPLGSVWTKSAVSASATTSASSSGSKRGLDPSSVSLPLKLPKRSVPLTLPAAEPPPVRRCFPQVLVAGEKYTSLEWFLGRGATPRHRNHALAHCKKRAVQLHGGNHNTLLQTGTAKTPPLRCKDLFPGRSYVPSVLKDTAVVALKHPYGCVQAKLNPDIDSLRNVLLRVCDLEECQQKFQW